MKKLRYLLLLLLLLTLTSIPVYAGAGGSGEGGGGQGIGGDETINPPSWKKTGFIYYIIDEGGSIVAQPEFRVFGDKRPDASHYSVMKTRYGGISLGDPVGSMQDVASWWGVAPFTANSSGNGGFIKNWLVTPTGENDYNCLHFIESVWGAGMAEAFVKHEDYILIVEGVMWTSLYNGSTYIGNFCGNVIGWTGIRQAFGAPLWSSNATYLSGNFPCSMMFDIPVLGVPAATRSIGPIPYEQQLGEGYGIVACWSAEITGEMPEKEVAPVASDANSLRSDELNMIYGDFAGLRKGGIPYPSYADLNIVKIDMKKAVKSSEASKPSLVPGSYKYDPTYKVEVSHAGSVWGHNGNELFYFYSGSPKLDRAKWKVSLLDK